MAFRVAPTTIYGGFEYVTFMADMSLWVVKLYGLYASSHDATNSAIGAQKAL